jgi:hypothetical protein
MATSSAIVTGFYGLPAGSIIASASHTPPSGFLVCDGSNTVSRTTYVDLFNNIVPNKGTVTITIATPGVVTLNSHGFLTGESIYLTTTGALPTGLSVDTLYYVVVNDANSFWLATSYANAIANTRITTSGSQSGTHTLFYCPYGLGSTTSNFKLPDQKNSVFRGRGLSTGFTSNGTTRMGFLEDDQFQGHIMSLSPGVSNNQGSSPATGPNFSGTNFLSNTGGPVSDGTNGTPRTGLETRTKNQGVNFFIKF